MKGLASKILLLLFTVFATLALVEGALWLTGTDYSPMKIEDPHDDRAQHLFDDESFVWDSLLIWRPRAGAGVFNRQGFRGPPVTSEKPPGIVRIATVGDSNTLGWQGVDGANWPADLERLLSGRGVPCQVVNAGVWGYSSHQGRARLRQVLKLEPDLVTISFGSNDAHPVQVPDRAFADLSAPPSRIGRTLSRFRLGRLLAGALAGPDPATAFEETQRVILDDYRVNLEEMIRETRAAGAQPVLLTRPYLDSVPEPPRWKKLAPRYNLATVEIAARSEVPVMDFYTLFKAREELFADESHFTAEGHRQAAELLAIRLEPLLRELTKSP